MKNIFTKFSNILIAVVIAFALSSCSSTGVKNADNSPWKIIQFENQANVLDIDFIDETRGFLVGSNRLIMESNDGGETWEERSLDLSSEENYRLIDIDFKGEEGWLIGQPSLVMHTLDAGKNWTRLSLGNKLPGQPFLVTTVDTDKAELATTAGAIYQTSNSGESWEAKVIDASGSGGVRDLRRTEDGDYVSVSSLGNFFSTLQNDSDTWLAHQRASSKRVQSIGFTPKGNLWMLSRGAEIRFNNSDDLESWTKPIIPILNGYNYLDMGWDPNGAIWAGGGNGTLIVSKDEGKTWYSDPVASSLPTNFIKILFQGSEYSGNPKGFILGERGYILKWNG